MEMINTRERVFIQDPMDRQLYRLSPDDQRRRLSFKGAVRRCWQKYSDFDSRARRSEFWWFFLFMLLVILLPLSFSLLMVKAFAGASQGMEYLGYIVGILLFVVIVGAFIMLLFPVLSAAVRRLHDVGLSGLWIIWDIVLAVVATVTVSIAFDFTGVSVSSAGFSGLEMMKAIFAYSLPLFALVSLVYLVHLAVSVSVLVFMLLDSRKGENRYGPSPKYP